MPRMMQAIEITAPGGPEVLKPREMTIPEPGEGQILVKVTAGVNRPDMLQRQGAYLPPGAPSTSGLEIAGGLLALGLRSSAIRPVTGFAPCCRAAAMPNMR
jgi:NADPH2:quinone reductase